MTVHRHGLRQPAVFALLVVCAAGCKPTPRRSAGPPPPVPALPARGKIVLLGDSTTWHGIYPSIIADHLRRHAPAHRPRLINRGARGATVAGALARLDRDVIAERPAMVIVLLGINDGGYARPNRHLLRRYREGMARIVTRLRSAGVPRIVLVTTTCVRPDSWQRRAYNRMLAKMAAELRALGGELRVPVVDLFSHFHRLVQRAEAGGSRPPLMADANHPNAEGYRTVARFLLRHLAPR